MKIKRNKAKKSEKKEKKVKKSEKSEKLWDYTVFTYIYDESLLHREDKDWGRKGEPWSFAVNLHGFLSSLSENF